MSRVSKSKKPTANAMRIQAEENRKMLENIKPLKLPSNNINKIKDKIKNIFKKKNKENQKEYFMKDPFKNEIASLTPPRRGPNPQGMQEGDLAKIGKGLKFRGSGDISYEKKIKPQTKVKATYNIKKKKFKNVKLRTSLGEGELNLTKDKLSTTANYSKDLLGGKFNVGAYKNPRDKGVNVKLVIPFKVGALSNLGCPHRENGVQGSDIKGVKPIQVKGKKFIGVK